jgi:hypothetical protein
VSREPALRGTVLRRARASVVRKGQSVAAIVVETSGLLSRSAIDDIENLIEKKLTARGRPFAGAPVFVLQEGARLRFIDHDGKVLNAKLWDIAIDDKARLRGGA